MNQTGPDDVPESFRRTDTAQASTGVAVGEEQLYADGFRKGEFIFRLGTRESVLRDRPGWVIADGTQDVDLEIDGVNYGKPDLTKRFLIGADGLGAGFDPGDTGGSDAVPPHDHDFTHESAHAVTDPDPTVTQQPTFAAHGDHGLSAHSVTQPSAHSDHGAVGHSGSHTGTPAEFTATPGSGVWINTYNSSANANTGRSHANPAVADHSAQTHDNNHSGAAVGNHSDLSHNNNHSRTADVTLAENDVTLSNNSPHAGGDVGSVTAGAAVQYPRYLAAWPLLKVYD